MLVALPCFATAATSSSDPSITLPGWLRDERPAMSGRHELPGPALSAERRSELEQSQFGWVSLLRRIQLRVEHDGRIVERTSLIYEYLTEEGVRRAGNDQVVVRPGLEELAILAAYSYRPSTGERIPVPADALRVVPSSSPDVFSDAQTLVIPYSGLAVGSLSVLVFEKTIHSSRWPLPWSRIYYAQSAAPIERFELDVEWPEGADRPAWGWNLVAGDCSRGDGRTFRCRAESIPALEADPDVASWLDLLPVVVVGERVSWSELAAAEGALVEESAAGLEGAIPEITGETAMDRLESAYRFVADEIRYVAFEEGEGAVRPRQASLTLQRGYGDCKDKVALFVAMAREAGLNAYPVLVATERYDLERMLLPSWHWFDHMMACVDDVASDPICLELTTAHAGVGELPIHLAGAAMLAIGTDESPPRHPTRLALPDHAVDVRVVTKNRIDCGDRLEEELTLTYRGGLAIALRSALAGRTSKEREDYLRSLYVDATGIDREIRITSTGLESPGHPFVVRAEVVHPIGGPAEWDSFTDTEPWLAYYARGLTTRNQRHPHRMVGAQIRSESTYSVCGGLRITDPGIRLALAADLGTFSRSQQVTKSTLVVRSELAIPARTIAVDSAPRFGRFMDAVLSSTPFRFGLEAQ